MLDSTNSVRDHYLIQGALFLLRQEEKLRSEKKASAKVG